LFHFDGSLTTGRQPYFEFSLWVVSSHTYDTSKDCPTCHTVHYGGIS
jgi:hypothetical protein